MESFGQQTRGSSGSSRADFLSAFRGQPVKKSQSTTEDQQPLSKEERARLAFQGKPVPTAKPKQKQQQEQTTTEEQPLLSKVDRARQAFQGKPVPTAKSKPKQQPEQPQVWFQGKRVPTAEPEQKQQQEQSTTEEQQLSKTDRARLAFQGKPIPTTKPKQKQADQKTTEKEQEKLSKSEIALRALREGARVTEPTTGTSSLGASFRQFMKAQLRERKKERKERVKRIEKAIEDLEKLELMMNTFVTDVATQELEQEDEEEKKALEELEKTPTPPPLEKVTAEEEAKKKSPSTKATVEEEAKKKSPSPKVTIEDAEDSPSDSVLPPQVGTAPPPPDMVPIPDVPPPPDDGGGPTTTQTVKKGPSEGQLRAQREQEAARKRKEAKRKAEEERQKQIEANRKAKAAAKEAQKKAREKANALIRLKKEKLKQQRAEEQRIAAALKADKKKKNAEAHKKLMEEQRQAKIRREEAERELAQAEEEEAERKAQEEEREEIARVLRERIEILKRYKRAQEEEKQIGETSDATTTDFEGATKKKSRTPKWLRDLYSGAKTKLYGTVDWVSYTAKKGAEKTAEFIEKRKKLKAALKLTGDFASLVGRGTQYGVKSVADFMDSHQFLKAGVQFGAGFLLNTALGAYAGLDTTMAPLVTSLILNINSMAVRKMQGKKVDMKEEGVKLVCDLAGTIAGAGMKQLTDSWVGAINAHFVATMIAKMGQPTKIAMTIDGAPRSASLEAAALQQAMRPESTTTAEDAQAMKTAKTGKGLKTFYKASAALGAAGALAAGAYYGYGPSLSTLGRMAWDAGSMTWRLAQTDSGKAFIRGAAVTAGSMTLKAAIDQKVGKDNLSIRERIKRNVGQGLDKLGILPGSVDPDTLALLERREEQQAMASWLYEKMVTVALPQLIDSSLAVGTGMVASTAIDKAAEIKSVDDLKDRIQKISVAAQVKVQEMMKSAGFADKSIPEILSEVTQMAGTWAGLSADDHAKNQAKLTAAQEAMEKAQKEIDKQAMRVAKLAAEKAAREAAEAAAKAAKEAAEKAARDAALDDALRAAKAGFSLKPADPLSDLDDKLKAELARLARMKAAQFDPFQGETQTTIGPIMAPEWQEALDKYKDSNWKKFEDTFGAGTWSSGATWAIDASMANVHAFVKNAMLAKKAARMAAGALEIGGALTGASTTQSIGSTVGSAMDSFDAAVESKIGHIFKAFQDQKMENTGFDSTPVFMELAGLNPYMDTGEAATRVLFGDAFAEFLLDPDQIDADFLT